ITPDQPAAQGTEAQRRAIVYGVLSVRHVVAPWWVELKGPAWKQAWAQWPTRVWENLMVQPEARLVGLAREVRRGAEARQLAGQGTEALLRSAPAELAGESGGRVPARANGAILRYQRAPGFWRATARADSKALLVIANHAYPGWRTYVDGQPVEQARAYGLLQCVPVPGGMHEIVAIYWPTVSVIGGFVSAVAIAVGVALASIAIAPLSGARS
ncbi:MAG: YfhO family protein, partial [Armatimonadetes bacterium]|nr:YfhO family protein [Armatimonadota bacterium]